MGLITASPSSVARVGERSGALGARYEERLSSDRWFSCDVVRGSVEVCEKGVSEDHDSGCGNEIVWCAALWLG
jgi:hypothetical protein